MKWLTMGLLAGVVLFAVACDESPSSGAHPYPLTTCIVSDEKLGSMGKPYVFVHSGQEIKLCCKNCLKNFNQDPMAYMVKLVPPPPPPAESVK